MGEGALMKQNTCALTRKESVMGGPSRRREPAVRPSYTRTTGVGILAEPPASHDECAEPRSLRFRLPTDLPIPIREGLPTAAVAQEESVLILVGGTVLGTLRGQAAQEMHKCMSQGFTFTGVVQKVNQERGTVTILLAGSGGDTT
jgi:hypothetical protein